MINSDQGMKVIRDGGIWNIKKKVCNQNNLVLQIFLHCKSNNEQFNHGFIIIIGLSDVNNIYGASLKPLQDSSKDIKDEKCFVFTNIAWSLILNGLICSHRH